MKRKIALEQNLFIDPDVLYDTGDNISRAMARADESLQELSSLMGQAAALVSRVPIEARHTSLQSLCKEVQDEIQEIDLKAYGSRAARGLYALADESQRVDREVAENLMEIKGEMRSIRKEIEALTEIAAFRNHHDRSNTLLKGVMGRSGNSTGAPLNPIKPLSEMMKIYERGDFDVTGKTIPLTYQAARLAGINADINGMPIINNAEDAKKYNKELRAIKNTYSQKYIAAKLSGINIGDNDIPIINNGKDADRYLNVLRNLEYVVGLKESTRVLIKGYEKFSSELRSTTYEDGSVVYSTGFGCDFTEDEYPELYERYVVNREKITVEEANQILDERIEKCTDYIDRLSDTYNLNFNQNQYDALASFLYNDGTAVFSEDNYNWGINEGGVYAKRAIARKELFNYLIDNNDNYVDEKIMELFVNCGGPRIKESLQEGYRNRRTTEAELFNLGD